MNKVKITVSGRVQGVGFRYFVVSCAREYGIFGTVWNNDDGTVGVMAQSDDAAVLSKFIEKVRKGPVQNPFAKVTYLDAVSSNFPDFTDFKVSYTPH